RGAEFFPPYAGLGEGGKGFRPTDLAWLGGGLFKSPQAELGAEPIQRRGLEKSPSPEVSGKAVTPVSSAIPGTPSAGAASSSARRRWFLRAGPGPGRRRRGWGGTP